MKRILILSLLLAAVSAQAQQISEEQAAQTAREFFEAREYENANSGHLAPSHPITDAPSKLQLAYQQANAFYIYNKVSRAGEGSFVIVAADERMGTPILGWSDNGAFDYDNISCGLKALLKNYEDCAADVRTLPLKAQTDEPARKKVAEQTRKLGENAVVAPLLSTTWNQNTPYNNQCPLTGSGGMDGYGGRCPTGCVATAVAQVMNFWQWPKHGYSLHTNAHFSGGSVPEGQSVNFGASVYDWDNMLDNYAGEYTETEANAVAKLMADVGCAVDMLYKITESPAIPSNAHVALMKYFGYSLETDYCEHTLHGVNEWAVAMKAELDAGRPILCSTQVENGDHYVVCDGYTENNYYHINYGWGGHENGWYTWPAIAYRDPGVPSIIRIHPPEHERVQVGNIYYDATPDGNATVTGFSSLSNLDIQPSVKIGGTDRRVTDIVSWAFAREDITDISLPGSIERIPNQAFSHCVKLESVVLGEGIKEIGDSAFCRCLGMKSLPTLPSTLQKVDTLAFYYCGNTYNASYTFPASLKTLEEGAFGICGQLGTQTVTFQGEGFTIGTGALGFNNLKAVIGLERAAELKDFAIAGNRLEGAYTVLPTIKYGYHAIEGHFTSIIVPKEVTQFDPESVVGTASYDIPDDHPTLSAIGDLLCDKQRQTLLACPDYKLEGGTMYDRGSAIIPAGITTLRPYVFGTAITNAIIPGTVRQMDHAFVYCHDLRQVTCLASTPPDGSTAFSELAHQKWETELKVPNGSSTAYRQSNGWSMFDNIRDVYHTDGPYYFEPMPLFGSATLVGRNTDTAFDGNATIPAAVTLDGTTYNRIDLSNTAFQGDAELKSVTLPERVLQEFVWVQTAQLLEISYTYKFLQKKTVRLKLFYLCVAKRSHSPPL